MKRYENSKKENSIPNSMPQNCVRYDMRYVIMLGFMCAL